MLDPDLESIQQALKCAESAKKAITTAPTSNAEEDEEEDVNKITWLQELLTRQLAMEEAKERGRELLRKLSPECLTMPKCTQVTMATYAIALSLF